MTVGFILVGILICFQAWVICKLIDKVEFLKEKISLSDMLIKEICIKLKHESEARDIKSLN